MQQLQNIIQMPSEIIPTILVYILYYFQYIVTIKRIVVGNSLGVKTLNYYNDDLQNQLWFGFGFRAVFVRVVFVVVRIGWFYAYCYLDQIFIVIEKFPQRPTKYTRKATQQQQHRQIISRFECDSKAKPFNGSEGCTRRGRAPRRCCVKQSLKKRHKKQNKIPKKTD